jgi:hypothetical protein
MDATLGVLSRHVLVPACYNATIITPHTVGSLAINPSARRRTVPGLGLEPALPPILTRVVCDLFPRRNLEGGENMTKAKARARAKAKASQKLGTPVVNPGNPQQPKPGYFDPGSGSIKSVKFSGNDKSFAAGKRGTERAR